MGRRIYINIYRPLGTQCVHTSSSFPFKNNIHSWWKTAGLFQRVLGGELCNGGQKDAATEVGTPKGATEEEGRRRRACLPLLPCPGRAALWEQGPRRRGAAELRLLSLQSKK